MNLQSRISAILMPGHYGLIVLIILALISTPRRSVAATIVDTGEGAASANGGLGVVSLPPFLFQHLAGKFTLVESTTITSVEGWMGTSIFNRPALMTVAVGWAPGSVLFSGDYTSELGVRGAEWRGIYGLDWSLDAGDYWVSFIANAGFSAALPAYANGAPNPLDDYALTAINMNGIWTHNPDMNLGVRIMGDSARGVPDAGVTFSMLAAGFGLLAASRYRRKN